MQTTKAFNSKAHPSVPTARLSDMRQNSRLTVADLVILRQRPGSAKGVIFVTLEDETGVVNIVVWHHIHERFRRAVIVGHMLRVTGRLQRTHGVIHVLAEEVEDVSHFLDLLLRPATVATQS